MLCAASHTLPSFLPGPCSFCPRAKRGADEHDSPPLEKGHPMKLTKINIAKVVVPSGKSEIIEFDDSVPGFGLRVRAGGSATWIFQYRQGSKQRRLSLGSASAITAQNARERATELHARVRLGQDPAGEKIESRTRAVETLRSIFRPCLSVTKHTFKPPVYVQLQ